MKSMTNNNIILSNVKIMFAKEGKAAGIKSRPTEFEGIAMMLYHRFDEDTIAYIPDTFSEIPDDTLWDAAEKNTFKDTLIMKMGEVLECPDEISDLYVVTSEDLYLGASSVLNKAELAMTLPHGTYYMIPSSIHEVLLLRVDGEIDIDTDSVTDIIRSVNGDVVEEEIQLGDHAYIMEVN